MRKCAEEATHSWRQCDCYEEVCSIARPTAVAQEESLVGCMETGRLEVCHWLFRQEAENHLRWISLYHQRHLPMLTAFIVIAQQHRILFVNF